MRRRQLVPLGLPYLAALTPPGWDITLVDEMVQPVDLDAPADLVAISTWTLTSYRAYDLAAEFRQRGRKVILGGPHAFFFPEETAAHCDAVGAGEAEAIWAPMLEDAAAGRPCHIVPRYCTPKELEQGVQRLYWQFYSLSSMVRRLPLPLSTPGIASWVLNLAQRSVATRPLEENNFTAY